MFAVSNRWNFNEQKKEKIDLKSEWRIVTFRAGFPDIVLKMVLKRKNFQFSFYTKYHNNLSRELQRSGSCQQVIEHAGSSRNPQSKASHNFSKNPLNVNANRIHI